MLQVDNLCKSYSGDLLFSQISFSIQKGERCAFVGRNGSGKTTLLKILKGEETADGGNVHCPKGYKLGFLEQHIQTTEATVIEEALHGPIRKQPYEVESILFGLGFDDEMLDADPTSLSGGYHLRLKLAKLLAEEPNCLLLDEPTNYLDIAGLRWLESYLKKWKGEIVCISHDRSFLDAIATHTMGLHRHEIRKYPGATENFYQKILEEEELYEKTRLNLDKKKKHVEEYIERFGAKASKAAQAKSKAKSLEKLPVLTQLSSIYDLSFSFSYLPFSGKKMTTLDKVFFSYTPSCPLIQNVSLEIEKGKKIAIIGKNGMGKSTLLQLIAGELTAQQGVLWRSDQTRIGYFGQTNVSRLNPELTIEEEIGLAGPTLPYSRIRAICGQMMFSQDTAKKRISVLSGGEKSRVLLGKILASPTNLLLLDEPTHHLDIESIDALLHAIEDFEGSIVLVTHSEELLKKLGSDYLIIAEKENQRIFLGTYDEFLEKDGWDEPVITKKAKPTPPPVAAKKPTTHKITSLESQIETEEKKLQEIEALLAISYEKNTHKESERLLLLSKNLKQKIDDAYAELNTLYAN